MLINSKHLACGGCARSTKSVKTELPYRPVRNETIIAFFFAANKNNDNVEVSLVAFNVSLPNSGFNYNSHNYFSTWRHERRVRCRMRWRLIFGVKVWGRKTLYVSFSLSTNWFGFWNYKYLSGQIQLDLQWKTLHDFNGNRTVLFFPSASISFL